jgi:hypothetical protein
MSCAPVGRINCEWRAGKPCGAHPHPDFEQWKISDKNQMLGYFPQGLSTGLPTDFVRKSCALFTQWAQASRMGPAGFGSVCMPFGALA